MIYFCIQGPEAHSVTQTSPNVKARFGRKRGRHPVNMDQGVNEPATLNSEPLETFKQGMSPAKPGHVDGADGGHILGLHVHSGDTPKTHSVAEPGGASKQDGTGNGGGGGGQAVEMSSTAQPASSVGGRRRRKAILDPAFLP
jgi:hypothetical protein